MRVEVAYAARDRQVVLAVELPQGATVAEALQASGIFSAFPELEHDELALGIFGERVNGTAGVQDGDRVEIYRPLIADPKEARRRKAAQARRGR